MAFNVHRECNVNVFTHTHTHNVCGDNEHTIALRASLIWTCKNAVSFLCSWWFFMLTNCAMRFVSNTFGTSVPLVLFFTLKISQMTHNAIKYTEPVYVTKFHFILRVYSWYKLHSSNYKITKFCSHFFPDNFRWFFQTCFHKNTGFFFCFFRLNSDCFRRYCSTILGNNSFLKWNRKYKNIQKNDFFQAQIELDDF